MRKIISLLGLIALLVGALALPAAAAGKVKVNVLLSVDPTDAVLSDLGAYGTIRGTLVEIDAVFMQVDSDMVDDIAALPYVIAVSPDAERNAAPVDTVAATDFGNGISTWDLDAINVTNFGSGRTIGYDGTTVWQKSPLAGPWPDQPRGVERTQILQDVDFVNPLVLGHPREHLYISGFQCGGVSIGDVDADGCLVALVRRLVEDLALKGRRQILLRHPVVAIGVRVEIALAVAKAFLVAVTVLEVVGHAAVSLLAHLL